ncbi:hypothetical protein NMG29_05365 [Streptomyces cocklensis]|uniref:Uncharacterized protein n=1 Tax=Actinacidiphila cocklensis TaxID=887465 RepID=A0A9W4EBC8_9ACTN|nr:hypothetical protein [Actinacidiphila cocklensis]MDD1057660.1 hypothetical protein [Actinacidiphila cocklensis]CAG6398359.1 conserved hypothetical protein [Actinacidiphila cocklensis]
MPTEIANEDPRLSLWLRVRTFAVPAPMIETATARRQAGDWAGACAAAGFDVDVTPRTVARTHGRELAGRVRTDLRRLAPDLLRWHMPRVGPDGVLRPGLTLALARYDTAEGPVHLVARTPPAWADAGQRISLALWDGTGTGSGRHPHRRPDRRFRLDLHRHLWDASRSADLRIRSGSGLTPSDAHDPVPPDLPCAVDRWAPEAALVLRAEGRTGGPVAVRLGGRGRLVVHVDPDADGPPAHSGQDPGGHPRGGPRITPWPGRGGGAGLPVLPDAATWTLPDLELLRAGLIEPGQLHPLVAAALVAGYPAAGWSPARDPAGQPLLVDCRGARHRIGLVDGVLAALDHDPDELRREELLAALSGTPLPCLRAIDATHRQPDCLPEVRGRLDHGDTAAAVALVEGLLGPEAVLRGGDLRDELAAAAQGRVTHGLYRAGLWDPWPGPKAGPVHRAGREERRRLVDFRSRPRLAHLR